jgi:nucleotide-binding universal stress UspA family protein
MSDAAIARMETRLPRYRIVIALDGSEYSQIVLEHALDQASRHEAPDLHIVRVVDDTRADLEPIKNWLASIVLEGLDAFRAGKPDWRTRLHVLAGRPELEIANLVAEVDADLLVVGRYGTHHKRRSIADRLVTTITCPTLVVGFPQRTVETQPQCPECVAVRAQSDGERWFCAEHASPGRMRLSTLVPPTTTSHGGVW